jgi:adenylate cyclase
VPRHVAADLLAHPGASPVGREQRFAAVVLFADVSGFTAMSEALARSGRVGAEELTAILNSYFAPMIALIESYGGIIGKFGGDAMTVLFPHTTRSRRTVARRALQCALDMQVAMANYAAIPTSAGLFGLAMKAGLGMGQVYCTSVGDERVRLEYIIAGKPLDDCADAEHHASKGEVVATRETVAAAGDALVAEDREGFALVTGLRRRARPAPLAALPPSSSAMEALLAAYLHPSIAERTRAGQGGFINEHRKVTVLFVRFAELDYANDPAVGVRLQRYLGAVIATVQRYDGYLNKVDMGDKGSKYIVLFGTPLIHEDDEERALRCALDLIALPDLPARIGVNSGFVYCGQVGSPARQEYTVMGDPVNLAARLMQAAQPGQVLVSGDTWQNAAQSFSWNRLEPILVKGKREPIPVFALGGVAHPPSLGVHEPAYSLPMVGRRHELERAEAALGRAGAGQGQLLAISGEAGLGKSRLAAEVVGAARRQGLAVLGGACQSYGTASGYLVWQDVWRGFFAIDANWSPLVQRSQLEDQLAALDARLLPRMPLLGPALGLAIPDSALTAGLEPGLRTELLRALLLECLRLRSAPLLLVLEDCHWIDPLSQELLEYIGRNLAELPLAMLVVHRPPTPGERGPLAWAERRPQLTTLALTELEDAEAAHLIALKLEQLFGKEAGAEPSERTALAARVSARAQGNPFFIEEMINYIRDRGLVPGDVEALAALELPDSLHSLILSRIDQLAEDEKTTLKVASVIGRLFKASWLWGSYPELGAPEAVLRHLQNLSRIDLTPLDKPEPELEYLFKHITTQEVAYESLAFATRALLHEAVGLFVEAHYPEQSGQLLDVLAYHFGRGRNVAKQRRYFRLAGDAAKAAYANDAAVEYYQRLLPLLEGSEHATVHVELGEVLQLVGRWPDAEAAFRQALAEAGAMGEHELLARCANAIGELRSRTESFDEALVWLEQARSGFLALGNTAGLAQVLQNLSFVHIQQSNYELALAAAQEQLSIATAQSNLVGVSTALANIGLVHSDHGELDEAEESLRRAIDAATEAGYLKGAVLASNDLAGVYWQAGNYGAALECLQQALMQALTIGYRQATGLIIGNAGILYFEQRDYRQALACYGLGLRTALELGDIPDLLRTAGNIALVYIEQGELAIAERLYAQIIPSQRQLHIPYVLCDDLYYQSMLYSALGDPERALASCEESLQIARDIGAHDVELRAFIRSTLLQHALGRIESELASRTLEGSLEAELEAEQRAALWFALWQLDPNHARARERAAEAYAELHADSPKAEYRERYAELTGQALPEPPPLPSIASGLNGEATDPARLLAQLEQLLAAKLGGPSA